MTPIYEVPVTITISGTIRVLATDAESAEDVVMRLHLSKVLARLRGWDPAFETGAAMDIGNTAMDIVYDYDDSVWMRKEDQDARGIRSTP